MNNSIDGQCTEAQGTTGARHSDHREYFLKLFFINMFFYVTHVCHIHHDMHFNDRQYPYKKCYEITDATDTNNGRSRNSEHTDQDEKKGENMMQSSEHDTGIMCT